jgi:hypothetical protein
MTAELRELVSELSVEAPLSYQRLRVFPLRPKGTSDLKYLTLDESAAALVTVEVSCPSGSVPQLVVRNRAKERVFIPDGATLTGAKQNRVVNLSIMIAPESATAIPVSCVESGRWRFVSPQFMHGACADAPLRAMMCAGTTDSLRRTGEVSVDQGAVWGHVEAMLAGAGAASPTRAYHALYERWHQELADCEARLRLPDQASGAAVEIDGFLEAVDLFDQPKTLHKLWPKLVRGYLLAALRPQASRGSRTGVKEFIGRAVSAPGESYVPVGVGMTVRLTNPEAVGAALVCDGRLVHLSLFADGTARPGGGPPPSPAPPRPEPGHPPTPGKSAQPWWKFWA